MAEIVKPEAFNLCPSESPVENLPEGVNVDPLSLRMSEDKILIDRPHLGSLHQSQLARKFKEG